MKTNWITKGVPFVALMFLVAFGMMSCSSDPMSSPDNGSESNAFTTGIEVPAEMPTMTEPPVKKLAGRLRLSVTGECWYLVVRAGEAYELKLVERLRGEYENHQATVEGELPEGLSPRCSNFPVFKVEKILIYE